MKLIPILLHCVNSLSGLAWNKTAEMGITLQDEDDRIIYKTKITKRKMKFSAGNNLDPYPVLNMAKWAVTGP